MPPRLRTIGKQLLPSGVLARVQAARWRLRRLGHRARWLASGHRGAGIGIGHFDGYRIAYRLHSVDSEVLGHSFQHDIFFAAIPDEVLPGDGVVLDVGAHIGTFSVLAAARVPRGRVYAIEASRETFDLLRVNVDLNGGTNVAAEHLALADVDGEVALYHDPEGNYGHSITKPLSPSTEVVRGQTLATFMRERGITSVALAKFNCEGAEFRILLSAPRETVRRIRKMIVLYHCDLVQEPVSTLVDHLAAAGFATELRNTSRRSGMVDRDAARSLAEQLDSCARRGTCRRAGPAAARCHRSRPAPPRTRLPATTSRQSRRSRWRTGRYLYEPGIRAIRGRLMRTRKSPVGTAGKSPPAYVVDQVATR